VVTNGFMRVVHLLREKASVEEGSLDEVKLNCTVQSITRREDGDKEKVAVMWSTNGQSCEKEFDFVVVTLPLGVLKTNMVQFNPPLPPPIVKSIRCLGVGLLHKTIVLFDAGDWDKVSLPGTRLIYPTDHASTFSFILNLGEEDYHGPGLFGYAAYAALFISTSVVRFAFF